MEIKNRTFEASIRLYYETHKLSKVAIDKLAETYKVGKKWEKEFNILLVGKDSDELKLRTVELFFFAKKMDGFKCAEVTIEEDYTIYQ
jgi:hypothetical protein